MLSDSNSDKHIIHDDSNKQGRDVHMYGPIYDFLFYSQYCKKGKPLKVLEIGVATGISLVVWSNITFVEMVVGVDPGMDPTVCFNNKIFYSKHNGYVVETIDYLKITYVGFDIIIDDGSHEWEHQKFFLENYSTLLNNNGIMVCEDVDSKNLENILLLKNSLKLYILDLRQNINIDNNEIMVLKYCDKQQII